MNNAVKPESVPCEPDFEVNVDSPLAKLMCSLSAEDVKTNKKMLVECLNILSACYLTHLFPHTIYSFEEMYEDIVSREFADNKEMPFSAEELHSSIVYHIRPALSFKKDPSEKEISVLKELIYWLWKLVGQDIPYECIYRNGIPWFAASYYLQGIDRGNVKVIKTAQGDQQVRYGWYTGKGDYGGVHINNGVIARLCFLLCEGERFVRDDGRGFEVKPIGFDRTEELFGQLMFGPRRYLPKACNMYAFFNGILLAAEDLNFTTEERERIITACDAVNIIPPQNSSKFGSVSGMERKLNIRRANVPGTSSVSYAQAFAEEFGEELGLNAVGAGCSVAEESVIRPADLHAAVPTGGEVQVVLEQTWNGIPVFGASAIARVRDGDTVSHLENGFSMSLGGLRIGATIDAASAEKSVLENRRGQTVSSAQKIVFDPLLLGLTGTPCVAWLVRTEIGGAPEEQCIVDANSGRVLHSTPLRIID